MTLSIALHRAVFVCAALSPLAAEAPALASPLRDGAAVAASLRVCSWPAYHGVRFRSPRTQQLVGHGVEPLREFDRGRSGPVVPVDSSFPKLVEELAADRCDVATFAIAPPPQRQRQRRYSQPYLKSDLQGVSTHSEHALKSWADIDKAGVLVAVQAGSLMEPVMAGGLKHAKLVVVRPAQPQKPERAAGLADLSLTDDPTGQGLLDSALSSSAETTARR